MIRSLNDGMSADRIIAITGQQAASIASSFLPFTGTVSSSYPDIHPVK